MRFFNKLLKSLFVICFILSICLGVVLFTSSNYSLIFKDDSTKRLQLAQTASFHFKEGLNLSFDNYDESTKTRAIVTCYLPQSDATSASLKCEEITYVYDDDKNITKTVYFPGDGYKYVLEGESKTKEVVATDVVENYYMSLYYGASYNLYYMTYDFYRADKKDKIECSSKLNFNFNTFAITKDVTFSIKDETFSVNSKLTFDSEDKLIELVSNNNTLKIKYAKEKISFPSFSNYLEI